MRIEVERTEDSLQHDLQPGLVHLHVHDDTLRLHHWNQPNTKYELKQEGITHMKDLRTGRKYTQEGATQAGATHRKELHTRRNYTQEGNFTQAGATHRKGLYTGWNYTQEGTTPEKGLHPGHLV